LNVNQINENNEIILINLSVLCDTIKYFLDCSNIVNQILKLILKSLNILYSITNLNSKELKTINFNNSNNINKTFYNDNHIKKGFQYKRFKISIRQEKNDVQQKKMLLKIFQYLKVKFKFNSIYNI